MVLWSLWLAGRIVAEAYGRQLGGSGTLAFAPSGVTFDLVIPFERIKPVALGALA